MILSIMKTIQLRTDRILKQCRSEILLLKIILDNQELQIMKTLETFNFSELVEIVICFVFYDLY